MTSGESVDRKRVFTILRTRLAEAPPELKESFPAVVRQSPPHILVSAQPEYLMVVFLTQEESARVNQCIERRIDPFLGLVATGPGPAAIRLDKSKYVVLKDNNVSNLFTLSVGPDSTAFLENHHQSIRTADAGTIAYTVALAYIVSYGSEINQSTVYDHLDGLVAYSVSEWRKSHATGQPEA
jgi:hypothetical protein